MATTKTRIYYEGDGSTTDFVIPFDYLTKSFVQVLVDNVVQKAGATNDVSSAYYFATSTKVRFRVAPASGAQVLVKRMTNAAERIITFKDASVLRASDLNMAQLQTLHIAEEARDIIDDALITNTDGNWDARNRRIVNVGEPEEDQDAMTYGIYLKDAEGARAARDEAVEARDEAAEILEDTKEAVKDLSTQIADLTEYAEDALHQIEESTETVTAIQQDVTEKHQTVTHLAADMEQLASETTQIVNDTLTTVNEAVDTVLTTKEEVSEIANSHLVEKGWACARTTWTAEEDLPKGTVIDIPGRPVYLVGRNHLFISYDGIVMSPSFYNEVGEFNTASYQVSFNFTIRAGQELTAWVVPLGNSDAELYDRMTDIENAVNERIDDFEEQATGTIDNFKNEINSTVRDFQNTTSEAMESFRSGVESRIEEFQTSSTEDFNGFKTTLVTDVNQFKEAVTTQLSSVEETVDNAAEVANAAEGLTGELEEKLEDIKTNGKWFGTVEVQLEEETSSVTAQSYNDTMKLLAGNNIYFSANPQTREVTVNAQVDSIREIPEEVVIASSLAEVPSNLKVGGIVIIM